MDLEIEGREIEDALERRAIRENAAKLDTLWCQMDELEKRLRGTGFNDEK